MRLEELRPSLRLAQIQPGPGVRSADQRRLRHVARHCDARSPAVLANARLADQTLDCVAVGKGLGEGFEDDACYALL